jgi:DNA recombination protein RmuC
MVISEQNLIFLLAGIAVGALLMFVLIRLASSRKQATIDVTMSRLTQDLDSVRETLVLRDQEVASLNREKASLETRLEGDRTRYEEQLQLLRQARESLTQEFENLANRIFDAKQEKFAQQSKQALDTTIDPLRQEITSFRKKVEDAYDKENAERNKLIGQVVELQKQAQRVGEDAVHLANEHRCHSEMVKDNAGSPM